MKKSTFVISALLLGCLAIGGYNTMELQKAIQTPKTEVSEKDSVKMEFLEAENRLLRDELGQLRTRTYDDGYRDAIIQIGGPSHSGSFKDGYDAATRVFLNKDYADGYHAAIKQFGYTGLMLVAPNSELSAKPLGSCPVHTGPNGAKLK